MTPGYTIKERLPTLEEYAAIVRSVGWEPIMNLGVAEEALEHSLYGVVAELDGRAVGMGRVVGDGVIYFYVQDIAVIPEHQHKGIGKMILSQLLTHLRDTAPDMAFVALFAAQGTESFYAKFGFHQYPILTGVFQTTPFREDEDWAG